MFCHFYMKSNCQSYQKKLLTSCNSRNREKWFFKCIVHLNCVSMSSMTFGQKTFTPIPPEKGSFPLDHEGVCRKLMISYMKCLNVNSNDNSACRSEAKEYLACRMDNNLMAKEEWKKLGFE